MRTRGFQSQPDVLREQKERNFRLPIRCEAPGGGATIEFVECRPDAAPGDWFSTKIYIWGHHSPATVYLNDEACSALALALDRYLERPQPPVQVHVEVAVLPPPPRRGKK
jgi:hypothetical protein